MMDQKIIAAQAAAGDVLIKLSSDVDALKGKQPMSDPNSSDPNSATPEFSSEPLYGMSPNSFSGQTPPPSTGPTDRSDRSDRLLSTVTDASRDNSRFGCP